MLLPGGVAEASLYIENGTILRITDEVLPCEEEIDAGGCYVSPGFIDIHVHGGGGCEFVDATKTAVQTAANIHAAHGTTTLYPTISAFDYGKTANALHAIKSYKEDESVIPHIYGCHLEGPYFSPKQSGAQDCGYIRTPDRQEYEALYRAYGSLIRRWSYAPELEHSEAFLEFLNQNHIVASAGHTDATYTDVVKAYQKGMKLITHLYSCTSTITRKEGFRILGVIETAFLYDDIAVEAIADGCHLPPELLRLIYKIKGGEHMCLITDAIRHAGVEVQEGTVCQNGNMPYIIEDGVAKLADRSAFAGSIATADGLIRTCVHKAGIPLPSAVKMMTEVPAGIMGLDKKGALREGFDADIVIFDEDITIKKVLVAKANQV